jgi:hypothetical protein
MVLNTVDDVQSTLTNKPISLSPLAQSSISDKVRALNDKADGGEGILWNALREKKMPIQFRSLLK